jgi:hypothetical protein
MILLGHPSDIYTEMESSDIFHRIGAIRYLHRIGAIRHFSQNSQNWFHIRQHTELDRYTR